MQNSQQDTNSVRKPREENEVGLRVQKNVKLTCKEDERCAGASRIEVSLPETRSLFTPVGH